MVGGVPVGLALRDLFYAAGLGFLLCVGYSAARMLLGSGKAVCFICDAAVLAVGALLYRSAAARGCSIHKRVHFPQCHFELYNTRPLFCNLFFLAARLFFTRPALCAVRTR